MSAADGTPAATRAALEHADGGGTGVDGPVPADPALGLAWQLLRAARHGRQDHREMTGLAFVERWPVSATETPPVFPHDFPAPTVLTAHGGGLHLAAIRRAADLTLDAFVLQHDVARMHGTLTALADGSRVAYTVRDADRRVCTLLVHAADLVVLRCDGLHGDPMPESLHRFLDATLRATHRQQQWRARGEPRR